MPVPVDLARESTSIDSSLTVENVGTFSDHSRPTCSNQHQENDTATSETLLVNHEATSRLSDDTVLVTSSGTDPVLPNHMSDNCESILCQLKCNTDSEKPEAHQTEADNGQPGEGANDGDVTLLMPVSNSKMENDSLYEDTEPVDLCKLVSALWPKNTLMPADDGDCSFAALAAEHENYCRENAENSHTAFLSSCDGDTEIVNDDREALWPVVSQWLKESNKQSAKQLPRCSELIGGLLVSDEKRGVNSNRSPPKLTTDDKNAVSSTTVSSQVNTRPVSSSDNQTAGISNDVGRLGVEPECCNYQPSSAAFLSREKILSLQHIRVPLSSRVISRVQELKLKRIDSVKLQPLDGKRVIKNPQLSKQVQSNSSGITVSQSASAVVTNSVDSASTENTYSHQTVNPADGKPDATLASADARVSSCRTNMQEYLSKPGFAPDYTDVISGKMCTTLSGPNTQQPMTLQSDLTPAVSHFRPVSDGSPAAGMRYGTRKPIDNFHSAVKVTSNTFTAVDLPPSSLAVLQPVSVGNDTAEVSAISHPKTVQSIKRSELSTYAELQAAGGRLTSKKHNNSAVNGSETPIDVSYYEEFDSRQAAQNIHGSKHNVTGRGPHRAREERFSTKERRQKSRKDFKQNEAAMHFAADVEISPKSRCELWCSKCKRRQNARDNAAYDQTHSYTGYHQPHTSKYGRSSNMFDHYSYYGPYYMPTMTPSFLASISYSSYCLGAYNAHVQSMHYYNMLSHQDTANMWEKQDSYIRRMAKFYARS